MRHFIHTTFLGKEVRQSEEGFRLWEKVLSLIKPVQIIELGTCPGTLSLYFLLYTMENADISFHTFDNQDCSQGYLKNKINFNSYFKQLDIRESVEMIKGLIQNKKRTLLFCDDGDKLWEFITFAPFLKVNDIIGAHDWNVEISHDDIKDVISKENLKPIFDEINDSSKTFIKLFQK